MNHLNVQRMTVTTVILDKIWESGGIEIEDRTSDRASFGCQIKQANAHGYDVGSHA